MKAMKELKKKKILMMMMMNQIKIQITLVQNDEKRRRLTMHSFLTVMYLCQPSMDSYQAVMRLCLALMDFYQAAMDFQMVMDSYRGQWIFTKW